MNRKRANSANAWRKHATHIKLRRIYFSLFQSYRHFTIGVQLIGNERRRQQNQLPINSIIFLGIIQINRHQYARRFREICGNGNPFAWKSRYGRTSVLAIHICTIRYLLLAKFRLTHCEFFNFSIPNIPNRQVTLKFRRNLTSESSLFGQTYQNVCVFFWKVDQAALWSNWPLSISIF